MTTSRIPAYDRCDPDGMLYWFAQMAERDMLFHPEDSPRDIVRIEGGQRTFTDVECEQIEGILAVMYADHDEGVLEACYPIFMRAAGQSVALNS